MRYLTHCPYRRSVWTEHSNFPKGAVNYWLGSSFHRMADLTIYSMEEGRTDIKFLIRYVYDIVPNAVYVEDSAGNRREVNSDVR